MNGYDLMREDIVAERSETAARVRAFARNDRKLQPIARISIIPSVSYAWLIIQFRCSLRL